MKMNGLIVGSALLFAPLGCSGDLPEPATACSPNGDKACDDDKNVGYTCVDGKWTTSSVEGLGCDCFLDPSSSGCPVIGYVGIQESGRAERTGARGVRLRDRAQRVALTA